MHGEANIRFTVLITSEYLLQTRHFEAIICKTLRKFHIKVNIYLQTFAYKQIVNICSLANIQYVLLQII